MVSTVCGTGRRGGGKKGEVEQGKVHDGQGDRKAPEVGTLARTEGKKGATGQLWEGACSGNGPYNDAQSVMYESARGDKEKETKGDKKESADVAHKELP